MFTTTEAFLLGFIIANFSALLWTNLPNISLMFVFFACLLVLLSLSAKFFVSGILFGVLSISLAGHYYLHGVFSSSDFNKNYLVNLQVTSISVASKSEDFVQFSARLHSLGKKTFFLKPKILVNWHDTHIYPKQGQKLQLLLSLKRPQSYANPYSFKIERSLLSQNIVARAVVQSSPSNQLIAFRLSFRQGLIDDINQVGLLNTKWFLALSLGYRDALLTEDWDALQKSGTAHLFSISGMHLSMIAFYLFLLLRPIALTIRYAFGMNTQQGQALLFTIVLSTLLLYVHLIGYQIPVVRAFIAVVILLIVISRFIFLKAWSILLFVVALILIVFPFSPYGQSFWLSVYAVACVLMFSWLMPYKKGSMLQKIGYALKFQFFISLLTAPLIYVFFEQVSYVSLLSNILLVPIVSFIVLPLCLINTVFIAANISLPSLSLITDFMLEYCVWIIKYSAQTNNAFLIPSAVLISVFFAYCCWQLSKHQCKALVLLGLLLTFLVFVIIEKSEEEDKTSFVVFDVGHGNASALITDDSVLLFDTGRGNENSSVFQRQIFPFLSATNNLDINALFISHFDQDHAGGLRSMNKKLRLQSLISPRLDCVSGNTFHFGEAKIDILWPHKANEALENDQSCVLLLTINKLTILLPGDISKDVERQIIGERRLPKVDILLAAHHGSRSSSDAQFIAQVRPRYVVFTNNFANHWGHPHPEVVQRFEASGSTLVNTGEDGAAIFELRDNQIKLTTYRQHLYNRWYSKNK